MSSRLIKRKGGTSQAEGRGEQGSSRLGDEKQLQEDGVWMEDQEKGRGGVGMGGVRIPEPGLENNLQTSSLHALLIMHTIN